MKSTEGSIVELKIDKKDSLYFYVWHHECTSCVDFIKNMSNEESFPENKYFINISRTSAIPDFLQEIKNKNIYLDYQGEFLSFLLSKGEEVFELPSYFKCIENTCSSISYANFEKYI